MRRSQHLINSRAPEGRGKAQYPTTIQLFLAKLHCLRMQVASIGHCYWYCGPDAPSCLFWSIPSGGWLRYQFLAQR